MIAKKLSAWNIVEDYQMDEKKRIWIEAMKAQGHMPIMLEDGSLDECVLDADPHNGPGCQACGWSVCWHCEEVKDIPPCTAINMRPNPPPLSKNDLASVLQGSSLPSASNGERQPDHPHENTQRKGGLYWVKFQGDWTVAEWIVIAPPPAGHGHWSTIGEERSYDDSIWDEIGSRLERP